MANRFRMLLVEDLSFVAAQNWVCKNLPGAREPQRACDVVPVDSFLGAWKAIAEQEPYDGLILDMDLFTRPAGTQGTFPGYEAEVMKEWKEFARHDQSRITTGGLRLWAFSGRHYPTKTPPTIFFTGHGGQFGEFLEPMRWSGQIFWCSKSFDTRDPDDVRRKASLTLPVSEELEANFKDLLDPAIGIVLGERPEGGDPGDDRRVRLLGALLKMAFRIRLEDEEQEALNRYLGALHPSYKTDLERRLQPQAPKTVSATNQDTLDDVFIEFMHAIRARLLRGQFFPNLAETVRAIGVGTRWCDLQDEQEEPGGWTLCALFPEIDFTASTEIRDGEQFDKHYMLQELYQQSQSYVLNSLFSESKSPFHAVVHDKLAGWDPRKALEHFDPSTIAALHSDVRDALGERLRAIRNAPDLETAKTKVGELQVFLREDGDERRYITANRREEIGELIAQACAEFEGCQAKDGWREDVRGYLWPDVTVDEFKDGVDGRLPGSSRFPVGGTLYRLAEACRGFLTPSLSVLDADGRTLWKRDLLAIRGPWQESVADPDLFAWCDTSGRLPILIHLEPM